MKYLQRTTIMVVEWDECQVCREVIYEHINVFKSPEKACLTNTWAVCTTISTVCLWTFFCSMHKGLLFYNKRTSNCKNVLSVVAIERLDGKPTPPYHKTFNCHTRKSIYLDTKGTRLFHIWTRIFGTQRSSQEVIKIAAIKSTDKVYSGSFYIFLYSFL